MYFYLGRGEWFWRSFRFFKINKHRRTIRQTDSEGSSTIPIFSISESVQVSVYFYPNNC